MQWPFRDPHPLLNRELALSLSLPSLNRLVPIELPTRRRRVFRIVAMTGSVAVCLTLRAAVLVWLADRAIFVNTTVSDNVKHYCCCAEANDEPVVHLALFLHSIIEYFLRIKSNGHRKRLGTRMLVGCSLLRVDSVVPLYSVDGTIAAVYSRCFVRRLQS